MGFTAAMDLEGSPAACSICLDAVAGGEGATTRSTARLQCGHEFHLDCIGSAFNAKGVMQCPNCRNIEKGHWLYGNERQPCSHSDTGGWLNDETFDYPPFAFEFGWCPFNSLTPLTSVFGESESEPTSYYLQTLHGFHHPMYVPSSSTASTESIPLHQRPTGLEGHANTDLRNMQAFHETEPINREREHQYLGNVQMPGTLNHSTGPFGTGMPRYDGGNLQRSRPHMHAHSLFHRPTARRVSSPAPHLRSTAAVSETRGHGHGMTSHVVQQTIPSSRASNPQPPATRRVRPRALSITSFIAASSSAARGPRDFSLAETASTTNGNARNGMVASRHANQSYSWSLETFWQQNGEPHWWSAMAPVHNQSYDNYVGRSATELLSIYGAQNGRPTPGFM